jgi:hypothetical protein
MKMIYFSSSDSDRKPFSGERNEGIEAVPGLLRQLKDLCLEVEFVDITNLTDNERFRAYMRVIWPAVHKHYEIKKMFGTNRRSACWFGAEVPALLVVDADPVGDTYPHRKGNRITTIHDFLNGLLATLKADAAKDPIRP